MLIGGALRNKHKEFRFQLYRYLLLSQIFRYRDFDRKIKSITMDDYEQCGLLTASERADLDRFSERDSVLQKVPMFWLSNVLAGPELADVPGVYYREVSAEFSRMRGFMAKIADNQTAKIPLSLQKWFDFLVLGFLLSAPFKLIELFVDAEADDENI